ncbi:restriction endonuclease subunit S [Metabacillus idriensis]|uniref:restriction endonuclease subunit S n=1 Tax=Metabacillus idriensis TaxID=324768 RepID=UPI001CD5C1CA|nr:restriction endonuclease subunit S [Metabacillus idriensis]
MKSNYKRLGDYIREVNIRNTNLEDVKLLGVSIQKVFMPSIANTIGTNMSTYKIIKKGQFAYGPVTSRNGDKISVALLDGYEKAMISQAYTSFEVIDENQLLPKYLMMWFRRSEFDRYARFMSHGSAREIFGWDEMCNTTLPVPSITKQIEIVKEYNVLVNRINLNNSLIQKLEETSQAIYKQWFIDFEFPNENGLSYKSNGGEMEFNKEFNKEIPKGWIAGKLNDIAVLVNEKISIEKLTTKNYISTENMLQNRGGVVEIEKLPDVIKVSKFTVGNILISNIRPYFKKIWLATFDGGCSTDVLCFKSNREILPEFLYYVLERDAFFDYVMAGSKGTKMPRGDKNWIMEYPILLANGNVLDAFNKILIPLNILKNSMRQEVALLNSLSTMLLSKLATVED